MTNQNLNKDKAIVVFRQDSTTCLFYAKTF